MLLVRGGFERTGLVQTGVVWHGAGQSDGVQQTCPISAVSPSGFKGPKVLFALHFTLFVDLIDARFFKGRRCKWCSGYCSVIAFDLKHLPKQV